MVSRVVVLVIYAVAGVLVLGLRVVNVCAGVAAAVLAWAIHEWIRRAIRLRQQLRELHSRDSLCCAKCGYSLEGNTSPVCPECSQRNEKTFEIVAGIRSLRRSK